MASLRLRDVRQVYQLIGECRELGDDPVLWRERLFAGVAKLVSGDILGGGEMGDGRSTTPQILGNVDWGWEAGFNREGYLKSIEMFEGNPSDQPAMKSILRQLQTRDAATMTRPQMVGDREWYGSASFEAIQATTGVDPLMYSFRRIGDGAVDFNAIFVNRAAGRRNFNAYERRLVAFLHHELAVHVGGALARFQEPAPSQLPPRIRQVLRCLLEGDSDKQIACRLQISPHTVNQYTKIIYRHFGVTGRAALLAKWIRRGWSSIAVWSDDDPVLRPNGRS